jgi:hypothetical protein
MSAAETLIFHLSQSGRSAMRSCRLRQTANRKSRSSCDAKDRSCFLRSRARCSTTTLDSQRNFSIDTHFYR